MAASKRLTRFRLTAIALAVFLLVGLGLLVSRLTILNEQSVRADIASQLSAWTGGSVSISGPLNLEYFPRISLTGYTFELKSAPNIPHLDAISAREVRVELGLWSLLSREARFKRVILIDPRIELNVEKPGTIDPASLVGTVGNAPVAAIKIVNGDITASGPQTREKLTDFNGLTSMSVPQGALAAKGNFSWRGQGLSFTFEASPPATADNGAKTPVALTVQSPLVSAEMEGEGTFDDLLRVTGMLELDVTNLRGFARWLGLLIPDGPGLGPFVASGGFQLQGSRLGFNEGTFSLDGNRALGTMTVDFDGPRPKIAGTLAFSTIDLTEYWEEKESKPKAKAKSSTEKPDRVVIDFPLLHHLDFDLRLSTSEMTATPLTLGQVALSLAVNSGRLVADFAILDLCAGTASGRLAFDATVPETEIRLTGRVVDLALQPCLETLGVENLMTGGLDLSVDLASRGRTRSGILRHLGGKVLVDASPGEIGLDLSPIISNKPLPARITGWQPFRNGTTAFETASAELIFSPGKIFTDSFKIISGETRYTGEGLVDMNEQTLDFQLEVSANQQETATAGQSPAAPPATAVNVTGPWSKPVFSTRKSVTAPAPNPTDTVEARMQ